MTKARFHVDWQPVSKEVYSKKYQLFDHDGNPVDKGVAATFTRVATALASVERAGDQDEWRDTFIKALEAGVIPAGRIMSNAGAGEYKAETSLINCIVSRTIEDSMEGILKGLYEAGLTLKAGCGIGYEFSTLRPSGAFVGGVGASTSGPLSFMDIYDALCATISSAGGRRGAQMATFDIRHPDVLEYITAKRQDGRLRKFNLSVLVTKPFIEALHKDQDWEFMFPALDKEVNEEGLKWVDWDLPGKEFTRNDQGLVLCKIYGKMPARALWDKITECTYNYSEPGIIFIDTYNEFNNNWFCETIRATNPCGEQGLPPLGACLLGSINLTEFVQNPFEEHNASFDWDGFRTAVAVFTRMMDNVVELNALPITEQQDEIYRKRRHGMGITGLGSALVMMCIRYGSDAAIEFTEEVCKRMALISYRIGVELAKEKGMAPVLDEEFEVTPAMLRYNETLVDQGIQVGQKLKGRQLMAYSHYMETLSEGAPDIQYDIAEHGCRFTHATSIAPTGTITLSFANNASNGIEPTFAHEAFRNLTVEGKKTRQQVATYSYELLLYRSVVDPEGSPSAGNLPDYFVAADDVTVEEHILMQAAAQKWIDSSISKTINVPTEIDFENFKEVYDLALLHGLKGCTTFRFNPEVFSGVLVKDEDLKNTLYKFTLEDGSEVEATGADTIEYQGEQHNAAMLFDALKEGQFERGY